MFYEVRRMDDVRIPISKDFLLREFENISRNLDGEVNLYLIGGCALSLLQIKSSTYDADVIIETPTETEIFAKACQKSGYTSKYKVKSEHKGLYPDRLFDNPKTHLHIDIFTKLVVGKLRLTSEMKQRAIKFKDLGNLHIYTCSKEDIFLFKALAFRYRERDLEDLELLYTSGLKWNIIKTEILQQSAKLDSRLSIFFIEMIDEFQERRELTIPKEYLTPIRDLAEKTTLENFVRAYVQDGKSDGEILKALEVIFDQAAILEAIKRQKKI